MTARLSNDWTRPEDLRWGERLRWQLVTAHGAPAAVVNRVLAEAQEACAEAGTPVAEVFGPADAYAAEVARDRVPVEVRAQTDLDGASPRDHRQTLALGAGGSGALLCLLIMLQEGWSVGLTSARLALLATVMLGFTLAMWGFLDRQAGRPRRGWVLWGVALAAVTAGAAVADQLRDRPPLGTVGVVVPLAACVGLVALSARLPTHARPEPDPRSLTAEEWFTRLAGLLRGRYYVRRADVARHLAETEAYWRESGAEHPHDEFGTPQVYALSLVEGSRRPRAVRQRVEAWAYTAIAAGWLWLVVITLIDGPSTDLWWRVGGFAVFTLGAWLGWRRAAGPA